MKNLFFLLLLLCVASCTKSEVNTSNINKEVKSTVFQCCNIWEEFLDEDNNITEAVAELLDDKNISFADFKIIDIHTTAPVCELCCLCPTSTEVTFKVKKKDLEEILNLGFEQI